jgi:HSP20 family protein
MTFNVFSIRIQGGFAMSELIPWKNQELDKLRKEMDRLFDWCRSDVGRTLLPESVRESPHMDITETEDSLILIVALPGFDTKELDLSVKDNRLTLKGRKKEETVESSGFFQRVERRIGSFSRTIPLPFKVKAEDIKAVFKQGVLRVVIQKPGPKGAQSIQIEVD